MKDYPAAAFLQFSIEDGLNRRDIKSLIKLLGGPRDDEFIPVMYEANNTSLFGLVRYCDADDMDFCIEDDSFFATAVMDAADTMEGNSADIMVNGYRVRIATAGHIIEEEEEVADA